MSKWLKLLIGFFLSFLGLFFSFQNINLNDTIKSFESIDYIWILWATILLIFYTYLRSIRWRILLFSLKPVSVKELFASNMVGYFGNSILPFKMGEVSFHHNRSFHTAAANKTNQTRVVLANTFFADGTRIVEQPTMVSGDWQKFIPGVNPGEIAASELNPVCWCADEQ